MTSNIAIEAAARHRTRLLRMGALVSIYIFFLGCFTLSVLLEYENWSEWTDGGLRGFVRRLLDWNPMIVALLFNGGLLGTVYCLSKLYEKTEPEQETGTNREQKKKNT